MQVATPQFHEWANAQMRPISWGLKMAFTKTVDESFSFFILDETLLDGSGLLKPSGDYDNVVQLWDMYQFDDFSDRVISLEWSREESIPYSINQAMADIVLDNHDNYFSPGGGSEIEEFLLPRRPVRILAGFGGTNISVFVGLTESAPKIDEDSKTVTFHCIDFLSYLFNKSLTESQLFVDMTTDQILDELFQMFGLSSDQYVLDAGFNRVPFAYFEKGTKLGKAIEELMEAEIGALYMDEVGIIRFKNKQLRDLTPVWSFDDSNTIDISTPRQEEIINVVDLSISVRSVREHQLLYQLSGSEEILPGDIKEVWAEFQDPVVSAVDPILGFRIENSYMRAFMADSTESDEVTSDVVVTSTDLFATSMKILIQNNNDFPVFINELEIWGEPAKASPTINSQFKDDESVDKYEEYPHTIDNNLIQSYSQAKSAALTILQYFGEYGNVFEAEVKGNMALQISDPISVSAGSYGNTFLITKYQNRIMDGRFTQILKAKENYALSFFFLDTSLLDSDDRLAP